MRIIKNIKTKYSQRILTEFNENFPTSILEQQQKIQQNYNNEIIIERSVKRNFKALQKGKTKSLRIPKLISLEHFYKILERNKLNDNVLIRFGTKRLGFRSFQEFKDIYQETHTTNEFNNYQELLETEFQTSKFKPVLQIVKPPIRAIHQGALFKYLLKEDKLPELNIALKQNLTIQDLNIIGIYTKFNRDNYKNNCLYNALKHLGLSSVDLEILKTIDCFKGLTVITSKLKNVANLLNIYIKVTLCHRDTLHYGDKTNKLFHLDLYDGHYFVHKRLYKCSYLSVVKFLIENKDEYLKEIDLIDKSCLGISHVTNDFRSNILKDYFKNINTTQLYKSIEPNKKNDITYINIFFDVETQTINNKLIVYQICFEDDYGNSFEFNETIPNFINCFLDKLNEIYTGRYLRLIALNSKFDFSFIFNNLSVHNICWLDTSFIFSDCSYRSLRIKVNDAYKYINLPLKEYSKAFGLQCIKEQFPYDALTNYKGDKRVFLITQAVKHVQDVDDFLTKIEPYKIGDDHFNLLDYSAFYCKQDCRVLRQGYNKFKILMKEKFEMDIDQYNTLSSISHNYNINQGCYDGVKSMRGLVQKFIQESVRGGRCMTSENKSWNVKENIVNFDGRSLYPSAMARMRGFLKGNPKLILDKDLNVKTLNKRSGYFVQIKITKVNKHRLMPCLSKKVNGIIEYTNHMENERLIVDGITLNEYIKYHEIEFEMIQGIYFNKGYNDKINSVISNLYNKRLQLKQEKNESEIVFKLMLNAGFGKTILKERPYKDKIIQNSKLDAWISKHYNDFVSSTKLNKKITQVKFYQDNTLHCNIPQVGSYILAVSKQIMNEVLYLAEDKGVRIFYQDTDSMHFEQKHLPILELEYRKQFNRDLIGTSLGQFHNDFKMKQSNGKEAYALQGIYAGKKDYCEEITDGDSIEYNCKVKGIPSKTIDYYMKTNNIQNELRFFEQRFQNEIILDLLHNHTVFKPKYTSNYQIELMDSFTRTVAKITV